MAIIKQIKATLISFILITHFNLLAQSPQRIKIGSPVPDLFFNEVINYETNSLNLSRYKGKATILNLWNTRCSMAISALLALDSIQNAYPNDVEILNVSGESAEKINQYISSHTLIKDTRLPNVVDDTLMQKHIPHWVEPLLIYIDKNGVVKAIAAYNHYRPENVTKLLNGDDLNLPDDTDDTPPRIKNAVDPLIFNDYVNRKKNIIYYSFVSAYQDNVSSRSSEYLDSNGTIRILAVNSPLARSYMLAYLGLSHDTDEVFYPSVSIKREDTKPYKTFSGNIEDTFCFEQISKDSNKEDARKKVPELLDSSLGLKSSLTREIVKCWVFREIKNSTVQKQLASKRKGETYIKDNIFHCDNATVLGLIPPINIRMQTPVPIYNEIGRKRVTFTMPLTYHDRDAMNKALNEYGLELIEEERQISVITLRDR